VTSLSIPEHPPVAAIVRMAVGLTCFLAMGTCVLWAVITSIDRVNQVNERLPPERKIGFSLGFIGPERNPRFEKEYEQLFPDRTLRKKERILWLLGAIGLIGFAIALAPFL
jgi:hypothetical protein